MKFTIHPVELRAAHPNTAVLTLKSKGGPDPRPEGGLCRWRTHPRD